MLKQQIDADLKTAMLAKDKTRTDVLRGLKSAILYEEVAQGNRDTGLSDEAILTVMAKEVKKRAESAELYEKAGAQDRAEAELQEKKIIEAYLPAQLSDAELEAIVSEVIASSDNPQMGPIIGQVKQRVGLQANGARISTVVKEKLQK